MQIVFIHGVNQQRFTAESLAQQWYDIFQRGLAQSGMNPELNLHALHFPYYADLLDQHLNTELESLLEAIPLLTPEQLPSHRHNSMMGSALKLASLEPKTPLLDQLQSWLELPLSQRMFIWSHLAKDHIYKEMVMLLSRFPKLHESVIQRYIVEAYYYLANPTFMQLVHHRILSLFQPNQDYIVVAHSLGSVVALNVLQLLAPNIRIHRFITLASPLAFPVIQQKLQQPLHKPNCLQGEWHNFIAEHDYLASYALQPPFFNMTTPIQNTAIHTFADKPHEIIGYLQHPLVVKCIVDALQNDGAYALKQA